jgi:hypothetical protein
MTKRIVSNPSKPPFDRAAKKAQLEERATEGAKAISEYNAAREAERAKTERLRALRLAKEAMDRTKKKRWHAMTYEGRVRDSGGLGRNEWMGHNDPLSRCQRTSSSVVCGQGHGHPWRSNRSSAWADNWLKRQKLTARATSSQ